ncbi:MAG: sigma-70 family RNA polymerase sigma factor [Peptococcaceae bacterium]|nr:sigma-70 family RNA polymerase sigma factor [Peptococcaceae bacterium]
MLDKHDKEIIQLLQNNPEEGVKLVLKIYGGPVMTICRNILFDCRPEDIEEAAADSIVGLWRSIHRFQDDQKHSLKSYLYGIARHTALDKRRSLQKQAPVLPIEEVQIETEVDVESHFYRKMIAHILHEAVNEMGEPDRSIFILRYFFFAKVKDIATRLGLKPKEVENRLYYGKNKLRQSLMERGIYDEETNP